MSHAIRPSRDAEGHLLQRLLDTPHLAKAVARLQPELLHRVIQHRGLEDSAELVALATPEQLTRVFDLDLWRSTRAGVDEQFDAARFGTWLSVLLEGGADTAAAKLAAMDPDLMAAGLAQHARVFDAAAAMPYMTLEGELAGGRSDDETLTRDVGGYYLVARRTDAWEAIVEVLLALESAHGDAFRRLMAGCRAVSSSRPEVSGMDDLLEAPEQAMFDIAVAREHRREGQGYVAPAQASAFLDAVRQLRLDAGGVPPVHPIAAAYFRALAEPPQGAPTESPGRETEAGTAPQETSRAAEPDVAAVIELLRESGVLGTEVRALAAGQAGEVPRLSRIRTALQDASEPLALARQGELGYLANVMMAGCSLQDRPFEPQQASDAVLAVCNLGLEYWPAAADDSLHDLVPAFEIGWAALHQRVGLPVARGLMSVLATVRTRDRDVQIGLARLRADLARQIEAETPWRARPSLDVIASLDLPAWAALLGLFGECPVMASVLAGPGDAAPRRVSATAFEFISERAQVARVHEFLAALPEILGR